MENNRQGIGRRGRAAKDGKRAQAAILRLSDEAMAVQDFIRRYLAA